MSVLMNVSIVVYFLIFMASVSYSVKFHFGKESKDERGNGILHASYAFAYPIIIFGWLIITLTDEYINSFSLDGYKMAMMILLTGTNIIHAIILFSLKKLS
ncbi:hypothetical protein [Oceanobacillus massiliensis]|uniref:hypothetical protein n=1 Tax=Oceanobacillus massiliensis TaxID=1465765 RepID=UPI000287A5E5|nr:hypothetical protein [Oceanobacillus massiliensis]